MTSTQKTVSDWAVEFGQQVRAVRLRLNHDQAMLAKIAGVSLTALRNLESGTGASVKTLIRVLRALNRAEWLVTLAPPVSISPMQMLNTKSPKQRASSPRKIQKD